MTDYEKVYQDFWKETIYDENGDLDIEQIKKELYDYYFMLTQVPKVYDEVTGGYLSKPFYTAETVIDIFNEKFGNKAYAVDILADDWDNITAVCQTNNDYKTVIFDYLGIEE